MKRYIVSHEPFCTLAGVTFPNSKEDGSDGCLSWDWFSHFVYFCVSMPVYFVGVQDAVVGGYFLYFV